MRTDGDPLQNKNVAPAPNAIANRNGCGDIRSLSLSAQTAEIMVMVVDPDTFAKSASITDTYHFMAVNRAVVVKKTFFSNIDASVRSRWIEKKPSPEIRPLSDFYLVRKPYFQNKLFNLTLSPCQSIRKTEQATSPQKRHGILPRTAQ